MRTIVLSLADIALRALGGPPPAPQRRRHVDRSGLYPLIRASITVVMRDLITALLIADIVEGVPVSYATFVGYDEVAHHSGIREPDALAVLKRHDRQLARLERATTQSPRPYHLVVLSDHGQTQGAPFRQRYGETLEEVVQRRARARRGVRPRRDRRGLGRRRRRAGRRTPGARLRRARSLARATRSRSVEGTVALGPNREALAERERARAGAREQEAVVLASGQPRARLPAAEHRSGSRSSRSPRRIRGCWTPSPPIPGSGS